MAILSTKIGLSIGCGYGFRGEAYDVEMQKTGTELFLKYNFRKLSKKRGQLLKIRLALFLEKSKNFELKFSAFSPLTIRFLKIILRSVSRVSG